MKANKQFSRQSLEFWANVRLISQEVGYTVRGAGQIRVPSQTESVLALTKLGLETKHLFTSKRGPTDLAKALNAYFEYRADILNTFVKPRLMTLDRIQDLFIQFTNSHTFSQPFAMNKQSGDKKTPAYFTAIVNMLIEANTQGMPCDFNPQVLTTITRSGSPYRTMSRRVDGAFTSAIDPIAIWEIKEYYFTTTFGSRVADGVYESLLDGLELQELFSSANVQIQHLLMLDGYSTWWEKGRSYLCRIVDMLHMGYVDEVLFGYEVVERLPSLVKEWVHSAKPS